MKPLQQPYERPQRRGRRYREPKLKRWPRRVLVSLGLLVVGVVVAVLASAGGSP